jgi:spore coat protein CotH
MTFRRTVAPLLALLALAAAPARASVVINEIFYNAPDDLDDLQWIELHNTTNEPADLSDWKLDKGDKFTFPQGTKIDPDGYLVVALKPDLFQQHYNLPALGPLKKNLQRNGERLELHDASGDVVDAVRYDDRHPYPISADGDSASLERICPTAPAGTADNWAPSPLPQLPAPGGTPGKQNAAFSATLPPVVVRFSLTPENPTPTQNLRVEAELKSPDALKEVTLLYRVVTNGNESTDVALPMTRDRQTNRYAAAIPPQPAGTIVRARVKAVDEDDATRVHPAEHDIRPMLSVLVHDKWDLASLPGTQLITIRSSDPKQRKPRGIFSLFGGGNDQPDPNAPRPTRGSHAFVYADRDTGKTLFFDYVHAHPRGRGNGYTVHFNKDQTLDRMTAVSILHEGHDRFLFAETLAYDLYRRAGHLAPNSRFVRFSLDNRTLGHHLMVERPNKGFLRRNKIDADGNLYKIIWFGRGLVGQHQKKSYPHTGHADLVEVVEQLQRTANDPDAQWKVIQDNFDVENAANFFAINMVLSDWDGFFNNYYTYHDPKTNKWLLIPWDRDKTWGYHDGIARDAVFTNMPITNGMEGDAPPGSGNDANGFQNRRMNPFGGPTPWWRPGGHFSRPLLANPHFRKIYLEKIRTILDRHYTKETYFPLIDSLAKSVKEDLAHRASTTNTDATWATTSIDHAAESLKRHLTERREFLLAQNELPASAAPSK